MSLWVGIEVGFPECCDVISAFRAAVGFKAGQVVAALDATAGLFEPYFSFLYYSSDYEVGREQNCYCEDKW